MRFLAAVVAVASVPLSGAVAQDIPDELLTELNQFTDGWLEEKSARYGMDITLDGKVWINMDPYGDREDYAVGASELLKTSGDYRKVWIRGYHAKDDRVPYRESKRLFHVGCKSETFSEVLAIFYSADGQIMDQYGPTSFQPVVPGSLAAGWMRFVCR